MKKLLLAAAFLLLSAFSVKAAEPTLTEKLSAATVAVYQGKQVCKWTEVPGGFFGPEQVWGCTFESKFTCTATVVDSNERGSYVGLTAGHCFNWENKDEYYVADEILDHPVLHKIVLQKFEYDERYDFGVFTFKSNSLKSYPVFEIDLGSVPAIGTQVENVNFALGLTKQVTQGQVVSGIIQEPGPRVKDLKGRYLANLQAGPGASGSAVVDVNTGKIVGLIEYSFPGTQMPMGIIPTGQTLINFMDDDSAGLEPQKELGPPPVETPVIREQHTAKDFQAFLALGAGIAALLILTGIGVVALLKRIYPKVKNKVKSKVVGLVSKLRRKG